MMSGNYFGKTNMGSSSSSSSSPSSSPSSSTKRSKRGNPEKPKQPQRGLGVAQLEKIRLHEEMGCCFNLPSSNNFIHGADPRVLTAYSSPMAPSSSPSSSSSSSSLSRPLSVSPSSYSFQQSFTAGLGEYGTTNIHYGEPQPTTITSWRPNNREVSETFQFSQSNTDKRQFLNPDLEDSWERRSKTRSINDPFGSGGQNLSESSDDNQEVDLELRLSL